MMTSFAARKPHAYGMTVTLLGVLVFVPDALVLRLIGGDMMTVAVWRGLLAGFVFLSCAYVLSGREMPSLREALRGAGFLVALLEGSSMVLFCASIGATSVANALLIFAVSPLIAAILSWVFLRERIALPTLAAIGVSFSGVLIIASGSFGGSTITGDLFAFANACTVAGFYVVLRHAGHRNMIPSIGVGYLLGALIAAPFADFHALTIEQTAWLVLNGAVILPLAIALLSIGPRYLTAPEVSMLTILEVVLGPLLVWFVMGENPGQTTLAGGTLIVAAVLGHAIWRLRMLARSGSPPAGVGRGPMHRIPTVVDSPQQKEHLT